MRIPTSTSSSASRDTWSTPRRSASACTIARGSRCRTSRYDGARCCWPVSLPCVYWTQGIESRATLEAAAIKRICVAPERADAWRAAGFTVIPLSEAELASREALPSPGITPRAGLASPTRSPWIVANGWRFTRHPASEIRLRRAGRKSGARGGGGVRVWRGCGPEDRSRGRWRALGAMLTFLEALPAVDLPAVVGPRGCRRWLGDHRRGDEPARAPQPAVPGRPGAVAAISASTSPSAAPSTRAKRPPIPAPSR